MEAVGRQWEGSKKEKWRSGKNKRVDLKGAARFELSVKQASAL
ncbi:MAG: hypothetical protein OCU16_02280 [Candidatus Methanospirare jalkutatii]|nr:hypothetical protein [Candidatus Methanospirare jalkutatii]